MKRGGAVTVLKMYYHNFLSITRYNVLRSGSTQNFQMLGEKNPILFINPAMGLQAKPGTELVSFDFHIGTSSLKIHVYYLWTMIQLIMIQMHMYNRICTMYNVYSYSRQGENLVLVLKCHEKERKLGRQAMVEIDRYIYK